MNTLTFTRYSPLDCTPLGADYTIHFDKAVKASLQHKLPIYRHIAVLTNGLLCETVDCVIQPATV